MLQDGEIRRGGLHRRRRLRPVFHAECEQGDSGWSTEGRARAVHRLSDPHSFATWLRHAGANLANIQDLYGHTDTATTRIYAVPRLAKQHDAIRRLRLVRSG
ncbi:MAG: tyrosine-type recombinase/integrase [Acidobacteria bacterium]|nr:tyrosine-type recombinase/integrase [Acidobacteriota bacterium]